MEENLRLALCHVTAPLWSFLSYTQHQKSVSHGPALGAILLHAGHEVKLFQEHTAPISCMYSWKGVWSGHVILSEVPQVFSCYMLNFLCSLTTPFAHPDIQHSFHAAWSTQKCAEVADPLGILPSHHSLGEGKGRILTVSFRPGAVRQLSVFRWFCSTLNLSLNRTALGFVSSHSFDWCFV